MTSGCQVVADLLQFNIVNTESDWTIHILSEAREATDNVFKVSKVIEMIGIDIGDDGPA